MKEGEVVQQQQKKSITSDTILGFVPAIVIQYFIDSSKKGEVKALPQKQSFKSVVMFADISGFTMLTETLSKIGPEGAEVIAFAINRYMELLIKSISRSGGDIFKFAGDAMIVVWPPPIATNYREQQMEIQILIRQAIQSALDIQAKLNDTFILENIKLSVKIGFGIGDMSIIYVGGVFNRSEYLAAGDPLTQAFESEHHATQGGQTIISKQVHAIAGSYFSCDKIKDEGEHQGSDNGPFYFVKGIPKDKAKVQMTANALKMIKDIDPETFNKIKPDLMNYIPAALLPFIQIDQERWSSELRRLTIMFVNLGIDLSDAKTNEGLQQIQSVIQTVQKCVYMNEGSLNKLLMDDKGSTLIIVFGLPPMTHQDDPVRAIATAATLRHELARINCKCNIGIGTGLIFAGVVGTSGSRREYSVIGDSVNLAARLMQAACADPDRKIIIDEATAQEAIQKISIKFYKNIKVKGKENELPIYEPIFVDHKVMQTIFEQQGHISFNFLRTHNPAYPTKISPLKISYLGRDSLQEQINHVLDEYMKLNIPRALIQIQGTFGIGKSLAAHVALNALSIKVNQGQYQKWKYDEKSQFICANIGPFHKDLPFNAIRLIIQQVIMIYAKRIQQTCDEKLIEELIVPVGSRIDWDLFKSMFEYSDKSWIADFPRKAVDPQQFKKQTNSLKLMIIQLFALFLEHIPEQLNKMVPNHKIQRKSNNSHHIAPIILVCDDVQCYDEGSFKILKSIVKRFDRLMIILIIRDEFLEPPVFQNKTSKSQSQIVLAGIIGIENCFEQNQTFEFKMGELEKKKSKQDPLSELLMKEFNIKDFVIASKGKLKQRSQVLRSNNTKLIQPSQVVPELSKEELEQNRHKFWFQIVKPLLIVHDVNTLMLNFINLKTLGNPLTIMNFMKQLIAGKLLKVDLGKAIITEELEDIINLEEPTEVNAPIDKIRVNQPIVDKLSCLEVLLLKVASVIGDIFDVQTLNKIQPFKDHINYEKIMKLLKALDDKNIIELMEINQFNIYYRFTCPFMRETIYQTMIYSQRREVHRDVALAIQEIPQEYDCDSKLDALKLKYHLLFSQTRWSLTKPQEDGQQKTDELSYKAKRSMIVKQIQQTLARSKNDPTSIIIEGFLEKKSDANVSWANRYCVMTGKDFRYYYTPQLFHENVENALGIIPLRAIYTILPLNDKEQVNKQDAFQICTSMWIKKAKEMEERKFYFAANNEDTMEEWTIYLEFTRSMAIYDHFVNNFGKIQFPLGSPSDYYDVNLGWQISNLDNKQTITIQNTQEKVTPLHASAIVRQSSIQILQSPLKLKKVNSSSQDLYNQKDLTFLKNQIDQFLQKSLLLVYSHIFELSIQQKPHQQKIVGSNTKVMVRYLNVFRIDPQLLEVNKKHIDLIGTINSDSHIQFNEQTNKGNHQTGHHQYQQEQIGYQHKPIQSQQIMLQEIKEEDQRILQEFLKINQNHIEKKDDNETQRFLLPFSISSFMNIISPEKELNNSITFNTKYQDHSQSTLLTHEQHKNVFQPFQPFIQQEIRYLDLDEPNFGHTRQINKSDQRQFLLKEQGAVSQTQSDFNSNTTHLVKSSLYIKQFEYDYPAGKINNEEEKYDIGQNHLQKKFAPPIFQKFEQVIQAQQVQKPIISQLISMNSSNINSEVVKLPENIIVPQTKQYSKGRYNYSESIVDTLLNNVTVKSQENNIYQRPFNTFGSKINSSRGLSQTPIKNQSFQQNTKLNQSRTPQKYQVPLVQQNTKPAQYKLNNTSQSFQNHEQINVIAIKQSYSIKGEKISIARGQKVRILRHLQDKGLYEIQINQQKGFFSVADFITQNLDKLPESIIVGNISLDDNNRSRNKFANNYY